ncbi:MAG: RteC domain-containing protein [Mucilaginibacter sp.]|uniref:RteC domain-containing protein n=1 Tax=Mucilaginibacter sp. TaxID=1882438 RepID=UPI00356728F4
MRKFTEKLFTELTEELSVYADLGTLPVRKVTGTMHSIQTAFEKLKRFITDTSFRNQDDEIVFFKYEKPKFTAEHFYAMEIFTIETARPLNDTATLKAFYEQELKYIHRFLEQNKFLYSYYQFDLKELDHLLFVRGAKPVDIPVPELMGLDPQFTTCCDMLWGKFMAFERLEKWLQNEISELNGGGAAALVPPAQPVAPIGALKWTGESINLVEIAYGIWLTGQLNNGQVSITEIVEFLEAAFRIRIGKAHRRWQGIANRKRLGYTKFLDEMKTGIERRVEEELER